MSDNKVELLGYYGSDQVHAQVGVRELAETMLHLVKNIDGNPFEHTIKSFKL